jgi:PKD repeat protein
MKKRLVYLLITTLWLASLLLSQALPATAQDWQDLASDIDRDGLLNDLETAGWYNAAGGPFVTNPSDADSDDDGLTDGEEKLFDTHPLDDKSPGIYVKYVDSYQTRAYFSVTDPDYLSMHQAGDKYLMTEAMVARRGTTLHIGGPSDATLVISGAGLTDLTPYTERDLYGGGWNISLPQLGTVGTYTATLTAGTWHEEMPIHVIFEVPADLTTAEIDAFLYDEDLSDLRDETAVIWRTLASSFYEWNGNTYSRAKGWSQAFWTDQYQKYVLVDQVMPAIQGITSQANATNALAAKADYEVRVTYGSYVRTDMYTTLYKYDDGTGWTQPGSPCHGQAGVFSGFLRSAGIPSSPFIIDWAGASDYDTSVKVWVDSQWKAARSYRGGESGNPSYIYYPFNNGYTALALLKDWDARGSYGESHGNILAAINQNWDYEQWRDKRFGEVCTLGESTDGTQCFLGGTVGTRWVPDPHMTTASQDYLWKGHRPLEVAEMHPSVDTLNHTIWVGSSWLPGGWPDIYVLPDPYPGGNINENWPIDPVPQACPAGYVGTCPYPPAGVLADLPAGDQPTLQVEPTPQAQSDRVHLGSVVDVYGVDADRDGRYGELVVEVEVDALQAGTYTLGAKLALPGGSAAYGGIYTTSGPVYLRRGLQSVQLRFDGRDIGRAAASGSYQLTDLWITDNQEFDPRLGAQAELLDYQDTTYAAGRYSAAQFETSDALLADVYSHRGVDQDGDGRYEAVVVDVDLDILERGVYRVEGNLYDSTGSYVGHATWTGSGAVAPLSFDLGRSTPPYKLEKLRLYDEGGALLDSRHKEIYTIAGLDGPVDRGTVSVNLPSLQTGMLAPLDNIVPTEVFTDTGLDLDSDGLYDQLVIGVEVQVSQAGSYKLEGWLEDADGNLMAYALSNPTTLPTGLHTLTLAFDGRAINAHNVDGPYTLVALRILAGSSAYNVLDELQVTGLALDYSADDFEPATEVPLLFSDDMESGDSNWNWQSPWTRVSKVWPSPSYTWEAKAAGVQSGWLKTIAVDVADYVQPLLRFNNSFSMSAADVGYVEVSPNGVTWTRVATYTNGIDRWSTAHLDLSDFGETPSLQLRFNANSQTGLLWDIDDVNLYGWPAVTSAYFTYSPAFVVPNTDITFLASYDSIDPALPVTYTWDFGDGSDPVTTNLPSVVHQFAASIDYHVRLTVQNPYDDAQVTRIVGVGEPVTATAFDYAPLVPEVNDSIQFTAQFTPGSASTPITYTWDFGDDTIVSTTAQNYAHSYSAGGDYDVRLTTTNGYGTATYNQVVEVKEGVGEVSFTYAPDPPIEGDPIDFDAFYAPDTASQPITYTWDFGDGSDPVTTRLPDTTHAFAAHGTYVVEVTADNGYGTPAVYSAPVDIAGRPVSSALFDHAQTETDNDYKTTFDASYEPTNATRPITFRWDFGDGSTVTTTGPSATHEFEPPVIPYTYTVRLTVSNGWGSPVSYSHEVRLPLDEDGDGLTNSEENAIGTDPHNPDTDGDGLTDREEVEGYTYDGYPAHEDYGQHVDSNPLNPDTDGDGLTDEEELGLRTHPRDADTDDDGLLDGEEPGIDGTTDALDPDSDDDGLLDGQEVNGSLTDPLNPDTDGDGIGDYTEVDEDNDPNNALTAANHPDTDNDGISDAWDLDSDADGISDADEWSTGPDDLLAGCQDSDDPRCTSNDIDADGIWNFRDADSDDDYIPDHTEYDADGDGVADDSDQDGVPDWIDQVFRVYLPLVSRPRP